MIHLHVHSHYSLLDGLPKISDLVQKAREFKMPALALTDHGAMYGAIEFYKTCKEHDVKPILGMEAYVSPYPLSEERSKSERTRYHLTILAKTYAGYKNLMKLTSIGWLKGFYYKPRIDKESLALHSEGLILLSGCANGELARVILEKGKDAARAVILEYQKIVGKENYFLEIQDHPEMPEYKTIRDALIELGEELRVPLVATNDVHYINPEDKYAQDALLALQTGKKIEDANRLTMINSNLHFASPDEMRDKFRDIPESVSNTSLVQDMVSVELPMNKWMFPTVAIPQNMAPDEYLAKEAETGLIRRFNMRSIDEAPEKYRKRLNYELEIIKKKGFAPYFLVVADIISFARTKNIITTTRGSAAGSLVSYAVGITTADPMSFDLPFERFLNPYRPSPPDIDIDIEDARRAEVIQYTRNKYGADKVAHIITFGTLLARAAVRDMGRVLNLPYSFCDKLAKMIPIGSQGFKMTLERALLENPELKTAYDENEDVARVIDLSRKVEGCVRHPSVHAAGIVIAPGELTDFTPLQKDARQGAITTQYEMHAVEDVGLLKMDLLGITNLSILGLAREIISRTRGITIDLENLPLDDAKTYTLLARGQTMGVFQLSGSGMTRYLKELEPSTIFDIMAMISLYRPGPIESLPEYIKRKHNPSLVSYPHPKLKDILAKSYGIITYQDDVLLTAITLAGYNWESADKLRKAIGKKIPAEMAAQKDKFIDGCKITSSLSDSEAERIWRLIEPFAAYGFNKAHGSSYALVAYQTAYVKANFPPEFMAALLTCESGNMEKVAEGIEECRALHILTLPPDVNESLGGFTVIGAPEAGQNIRFGLNAIKHLGANVIEQVIENREARGAYATLQDFLIRTTTINKKSLEALVRAGALDRFCDRATLDYNIETMLAFARDIKTHTSSDRVSLFGDAPVTREIRFKPLFDPAAYPILQYEKEYLGLYASAHPLDHVKPYMENLGITPIKILTTNREELAISERNAKTTIIGVVNAIKSIQTKQGDTMVFVKIEDFGGELEMIIFPRLLQNVKNIVHKDAILLIKGSLSWKDTEPKFIAETIQPIDEQKLEAMTKTKQKKSEETVFTVRIPAIVSKDTLLKIKELLVQFPGDVPVYLQIIGNRVKIMKTSFKVHPEDLLQRKIDVILQ